MPSEQKGAYGGHLALDRTTAVRRFVPQVTSLGQESVLRRESLKLTMCHTKADWVSVQ